MSVYDEELRALREQMERKRQLDAMLKDLRGQQQELTARVSELEKVKLEEQADVDRLEGHSLDSAHGWATWDLLGGGLVADLAKHSHLDSAQAAVERLQVELRRFKTELADVTIDADLQVSIDGFLRFADYFFDGLFVDWAVMDRINQSQAAVEETRGRITAVLDRLNAMSDGAERESAETRERLDALVRDSGVDG